MPVIESELGSRNFNKMREFTVDDEASLEEEIKRQRFLKANPDKEQMNPAGKDRINFLLGLTRLTKTVVIENTKFVLKTLKSSENREIVAESSKYAGTQEAQFEIRRQILARSLAQIENMSFEDCIGSKNINDKLNFIDSLDETLCNLLFSAFDDLVKDANNKYGQKTPEQVKEVVEDLKK
jgi:hypothetical protein